MQNQHEGVTCSHVVYGEVVVVVEVIAVTSSNSNIGAKRTAQRENGGWMTGSLSITSSWVMLKMGL